MNFLDFKDIAEHDMELINPVSAEKVVEIGRLAGLAPGKQVIDFGCGYAEALVLWAERFGSSGVGIDFRPQPFNARRDKISAHNLENASRSSKEKVQSTSIPRTATTWQPALAPHSSGVGTARHCRR